VKRDHASIKLDPKKSLDKQYFDQKLRQFKDKVMGSGLIEELKLHRRYLKPSQLVKEKKKISKWKYYRP
jgi:ribosomal protein S21